ncbi:hypothetical protein GGS24DRAFT_499566 [Hypoxylon argillaceum]|nr:hypothetical protein GGS24DRAFT_499566 [Hypoxylon argillaceum]KAI1147683.1 hypothetical protein F4825DRAFT_133588 [Nemania diffusa]
MQFSTAAIAAILSASSVFAAPAAIPGWTMTGLKRVCNAADTSCTWSFGINTNTGAAVTPCSFVITGSPADHSNTSGTKACGTFSVTAGWSGQFGPGNGFTTLAVYNNANKQIAWPAYTDAELGSAGAVVSPDKTWAVTQM